MPAPRSHSSRCSFSTNSMHSTALPEPSRSSMSLSGPLPVPRVWLTQASWTGLVPSSPRRPLLAQGRPPSTTILKARGRGLPGSGTPWPSRKHMVTVPFRSLQSIPLSSFLPSFSPTDERKTARGLGREGRSSGLRQCRPRRPTEPGLVWDEYPRYSGCTPWGLGPSLASPLLRAPLQGGEGTGASPSRTTAWVVPPETPRVRSMEVPPGTLSSGQCAGKGHPRPHCGSVPPAPPAALQVRCQRPGGRRRASREMAGCWQTEWGTEEGNARLWSLNSPGQNWRL